MSRDLVDYTDRYGRLEFEQTQAVFRRRLVLDQVAAVAPLRLLEVGCGHHPLFTDLKHMDVTVVEPSASFLDNAIRLAGGRSDRRIVAGRLEDVGDQLGRFDMIVVSCLLHEVEDPAQLLATVHALCAPGAVVHVNVPNANSIHRLLAHAMGMIGSPYELSPTQHSMQQRCTYDAESLERELSDAGFSVIQRGTLFVKPFSHAQMQHLAEQGFLTERMLEGLYRLTEHLPESGSELWCNVEVSHA